MSRRGALHRRPLTGVMAPVSRSCVTFSCLRCDISATEERLLGNQENLRGNDASTRATWDFPLALRTSSSTIVDRMAANC